MTTDGGKEEAPNQEVRGDDDQGEGGEHGMKGRGDDSDDEEEVTQRVRRSKTILDSDDDDISDDNKKDDKSRRKSIPASLKYFNNK